MKSAFAALAIAALSVAAAGESEAAVVQFGPTDWVNQDNNSVNISMTATLTDQVGGVLFDLMVSGASAVTGDIFKIGFDGLTFAGVSSVSSGDAVSVLCNNCDGNPNGFQGGLFQNAPYSLFDTIVQVGVQGAASGLNTAVSFFIAGVSAIDADAIAVRMQAVSGYTDTSLKLLNNDPGSPSEVPLPAAGFLLLGGLGALGAVARRKRAA